MPGEAFFHLDALCCCHPATGDTILSKPAPRLTTELLCLALLATLWGSSYLFLKVAVTEIPPVTLIAVRVSIAAAFLMIVITVRQERLPRDPLTWRRLLVQSFFNSIGAWLLVFIIYGFSVPMMLLYAPARVSTGTDRLMNELNELRCR